MRHAKRRRLCAAENVGVRAGSDLLRSRRGQLRPDRVNLLAQLVEFPRELVDLSLRHLVREEGVSLAEDCKPPDELRFTVLEVLQL